MVLRHGEKVGDVRTAEASAQQIVTLITGSELTVAGQDFAVCAAAADVGGTFTDILLRLPSGEIAYHKVLSTPPVV